MLLVLFYRYLTFHLKMRNICFIEVGKCVITLGVFLLQVIFFFETRKTGWVFVKCFSENKKVTFFALCSAVNIKILRRDSWINFFCSSLYLHCLYPALMSPLLEHTGWFWKLFFKEAVQKRRILEMCLVSKCGKIWLVMKDFFLLYLSKTTLTVACNLTKWEETNM